MLDQLDNLDHLIAAILPLDRPRMIATVAEARRRAGARADRLVLSKKEARQAWNEVERLGRLLFFLKFGRSAPNASPHEVSLYQEFMAVRRGVPAAGARRFGRGRARLCRGVPAGQL